MRILYYGNFTESWSTESYIARALERAGHEVTRWQVNGKEADLRPDYDVFLFAKLFQWDVQKSLTFLKMMRGISHKVVCWCFDLLNPGFRHERYQWASAVSEACDLFCTTDGSIADHLSNSKVLRQGIGDDLRIGEAAPELLCEVLFLGDAYSKRADMVSVFADYFQRRFWHTNKQRGERLNDMMASCKLVVAPPWPCFDRYWSNRLYVVTGYGGAILHPNIEGLTEEGWIHGENCFLYDPRIGNKELAQLADEILTRMFNAFDPFIGVKRNGIKHCHDNFTYGHRVKSLLEWLS